MCFFDSSNLSKRLVLNQLQYLAIADFGSIYEMIAFERYFLQREMKNMKETGNQLFA
jgi:hypothetical protein